MKEKLIQFIKNFSYTITSNLVSLIISTLVVIVIPKFVGVVEYGYWQLYLFYSSYIGFLHFGWSDGIYLRNGGKNYDELDKSLFSTQFILMTVSQLIVALIIIIATIITVDDNDRVFIFIMVGINAIVANVQSMLILLLQATNKIKDFALINIINRVSYILLLVLFISIGVSQYKLMIIADIIGKTIGLLYAICICRDIVFHKWDSIKVGLHQAKINIKVGINLMFANIASMLIIGVVRFGIERQWDVATFGKISLALSISNLLMIFINAIGIVIFPVIRNLKSELLPRIYILIREFLMVGLFIILCLYFPLNLIFNKWLPSYSESFQYMALLFPITVYEGKMGLLINTYLKALRREKYIMRVNVIILCCSIITTFFTIGLFNNLNASVLSILILIGMRSIIAEIYLSKILKISIFKDTFLEIIMTISFVIIGWYFNSSLGFLLYLLIILIYIGLRRKNLFDSYKQVLSYTRA